MRREAALSAAVEAVGKQGSQTRLSGVEGSKLEDIVADVLNRWPSAGVAAAVVRAGGLAWFHSYGVADTRSGTPVDEDTVFRIGSVTKTITAVAVMQLWQEGLVDLDAPVSDDLRAFQMTQRNRGSRR